MTDSTDDECDLDLAVKQLEGIAYHLRQLSAGHRKAGSGERQRPRRYAPDARCPRSSEAGEGKTFVAV